MALPLIAAAAAPVVGGLIGRALAGGDIQNAKNSANQAVQELLSVGLPPDLSSPLAIQHLKQVGLYTPELEQAIDLGVTQTEQIKEDPALKAMQLRQMSALEKLSQRGLTPAQQAALQQERMQNEADEQSRQASLIQQMQARGQGGGGAELAARLQSSQAAANRGSQAGLEAVGQSSQAAQNALQMLGSQAGQVRSQDFGVAKDLASAADMRTRFNVEGAQNRQSRNVGAKNVAQQQNLSEAQRVADQNAMMENRELERQNQAKQQLWESQLQRAGARSGAYGNLAKQQQGQAQDTMDMYSKIGSGVGTAMSGMGSGVKAAKPGMG